MKIFKLTTALALSVALATPLLANDKPGEGKPAVRVIMPAQIEEHFHHYVLLRALQELGYETAEPAEAEYQTMHIAIGGGDADFTANHWHALHAAFFEESGGAAVMSKVGVLIEGALQGYLVDKASYDAGVTDISMLKDPEVAKRFDTDGDGKADLVGCTPGWGCERVIEHHLTEYGLRDTVTHNQGAYQAIIGDAIARHANGEPIVYYTWTPYWVSGVLVPGKDVEWLSVPYTSLPEGGEGLNTTVDGKNVGFAVENVGVLARNDFLEANPAAAKLFEVAKIPVNDVSAQALEITNGANTDEAIWASADKWIVDNRATFDGWLAEARAAAE